MVNRTVILMATDVKTRKLMGVSRETVGECLKSLQIAAKVLSKKETLRCRISCWQRRMMQRSWQGASTIFLIFLTLCRGRNNLVIVEGRRPHYWSCGATGYLSKACSGLQKQWGRKRSKKSSRSTPPWNLYGLMGGWMEVVRMWSKDATPPPSP